MVDISYLTFAINLILNLTGSKRCIDNVFILIVRIVFKAPTDKFNSAGTNHTYSVKYPILYFIQSISASFWKKKLIKQRIISSNELLSFSTHGTAYCFFDAHFKSYFLLICMSENHCKVTLCCHFYHRNKHWKQKTRDDTNIQMQKFQCKKHCHCAVIITVSKFNSRNRPVITQRGRC